MSEDIDKIIAEWSKKVDVKAKDIESSVDRGLLKAAIFCNGEALKNAMDMIYNDPIPTLMDGKTPLWKRTGLYKAAMGYGIDNDNPHTAIIYNTAPYAADIEYGNSKGSRGRPIMTNSVFNNKPQIKSILETYLKEVVK